MVFGALSLSCKDDEESSKKGAPIGAPQVKPPVERNLPSVLTDVSFKLEGDAARTSKDVALDALREKIAPKEGQAVGVLQRLEKIDERMAELEARALESQRACLEETVELKNYDIGAPLPAGQAFELKFQCQENLDKSSDTQLAFGLNKSNFYLMERTKNAGGGIMVLANASIDGTKIDAWQIAFSNDNADYFHIQAADGVGFEVSVAGSDTTGKSGGHTCGLHLRSNGSLIYLKASVPFDSVCSEAEIYCVNAKTFEETALSECSSAKLNELSLPSITGADVKASIASSKSLVEQSITGFIDFTEGVAVAEDSAGE